MLRRFLTLLTITFIFSSCSKDSESPFIESAGQRPAPFLLASEIQTEASAEGQAALRVTVPSGVTSFQIVTFSGSRQIRVERVIDPAGTTVFDRTRTSDNAMSNAGEFQNSPNTFNWPIFSTDLLVTPGAYLIHYQLSTAASQSILRTFLLTQSDRNLSAGELNINLIYAGPIASASASKIAISEAIEFAKSVFHQAGVTLLVAEYDIPEAPAIMPNPISGDPLYEEFARIVGPGINLYMAADVENLRLPNFESGITASNPGPFIPSPRSAVVISIALAAGRDGLFNGGREGNRPQDSGKEPRVYDETRVMAETITKELLRYLGLVHTVEFSGNTIARADIIDSPKCNSRQDCFNDRLARHNSLFPEPATGNRNRHGRQEFVLYPRLDLSSDQIAMINRSVGVE